MKRGILVSFSGFDGVGKSTQVKLLQQYLKTKNKKVIATERMFGYFLFKPFIGSLRTVTGSPSLGPVKRNANPVLKLWFIPAFIDIWFSYFFIIRPLLAKYEYVIADRFYTDMWANLLYYGYLPDWGFKLFVKLLPRPDKAFMLLADPRVILKREREFSPDYYKEQAKIYKQLAALVDVDIINANRKPEVVFEKIRNLIK